MNNTQNDNADRRLAPVAGYADGRPKWEELCDCATICRTLRPRGKNESLEDFATRAEQTLRAAYEHGADWNYNADCPHCDTGRKHTAAGERLPAKNV